MSFEALGSPATLVQELTPTVQRPVEDPSITAYLQETETLFTGGERAIIEKAIHDAMWDETGEKRPYNDIAATLFYLGYEPEMREVKERLQIRLHRRLGDYLMTKVDRLLARAIEVPADPTEVSGVFRLAADESQAVHTALAKSREQKPVVEGTQPPPVLERRPISKMNLESLLSKATIGSIDQPTCGQFNHEISLPQRTGIGRIGNSDDGFMTRRHIERHDGDAMQPNDILIELPRSRIRNKILPVPANHIIVGCLDQALELVDPNDTNPFCTRMLNEIEGGVVAYIVRSRTEPIRADASVYAPGVEERLEIAETLPFPNEEGKDLTDVTTAKRAVTEFMNKHFLYCCDDRLGEFIARHPEELGTIVDGLRVGHCDLLAWTQARYLRQMGHTAVVVGTEISQDEGRSFMRDMTHSRVGMIHENGRVSYLDPAATCRTVKDYALSHIEDEALIELETAFDQATDSEEKLRLLRAFRVQIDEKETMGPADAELKRRNVRDLEDKEAEIEGIDISDEEVKYYLSTMPFFAPCELTQAARKEMNKLADRLATKGIPLTEGAVRMMKESGEEHRYTGSDFLRMQGRVTFALFLLNSEKITRKYIPRFAETIYNYPGAFLESDEKEGGELVPPMVVNAVCAFPEPENLQFFQDSFDPSQYRFIRGRVYPAAELVEYSRFVKLMASALSEERSREFVQERFGVDEEALTRFAEQIEPSLTAQAKPKLVTRSLQAFTGKKTAEEYTAFLERAKFIDRELKTVETERRAASATLLGFLSRIPLAPDPKTVQQWERERDPFDAVETPYRPGEHTLSDIDQNASARRDALTVRVERQSVQPTKSLYVHIDTGFSEAGPPAVTHFSRVQVAVQSLVQYSRLKNVSVFISGGNNDYFQITPDSKAPAHVLTMRLLYNRSDKPMDELYGIQTKQGLPKNFLYLSSNQGKVNAVKRLLRKKTNVIAKNFSDLGMDIFPRLKVNDEE